MEEKKHSFGSGLHLPPVVFGTSGLGNLYEELAHETKLEIVRECIENAIGKVVFDSAGKYGAGLSLACLGESLATLNIPPSDVLISNKLGWYQTPLTTEEPTFEPGVWKGLKNDAVQKIGYEGILECFHQGNELLGKYSAGLVSVHDPDEYLARASNRAEEDRLYSDILDGYRALMELRAQGRVLSVGVGAKQWRVIQRISKDVALDWVMIANSLTVYHHPRELVDFIGELHRKQIKVINSAVFHGGFLTGSDYFDYRQIDKATPEGKALYGWRKNFQGLCRQYGLLPAEACFGFASGIRGVTSVALNTTKPEKVKRNLKMACREIPQAFWEALEKEGLISPEIPIMALETNKTIKLQEK